MPNYPDELRTVVSRRRRLILRGAVLTIWLLGVVLAVRSGWDPGPWWRRTGQPWPYPLGAVLIEIAKITLVSLALYDLLRPRSEGSSLARTARATGVFVVTLLLSVSKTNQPGYAYAASGYMFIVTVLLFVALIVHTILAIVRTVQHRGHAA